MRRLCRAVTSHGLKHRGVFAAPSYHTPCLARVSVWRTTTRHFNVSHIRHDGNAQPVKLRPYQEESIQAVLDSLAEGERRLGLSLATGSGKTVIFSHLIERVPAPTPAATQTLILAHRRELVEQAAAHCRRLYPDKQIDVEMGAQHASGLADITVASDASIMSGDRIMRYNPEHFKLVIVDEAHHIVAARYMDILRHFNLTDRNENPHTALVGVSATLSRLDGLSLDAALDHIVYHKDYIDMIDENWLAKPIFTTVRIGVDLSKVRSALGDFQAGALSKAVNNVDVNDIAVRAWLAKAEGRKSTLVFCVDTTHVADLTNVFRQHGIDARFITGDTPTKIRSERLQAFKAGEFPVLLNVSVFTEGTDIPNIDCVLLARPTKSRNLLVQMIGRGLRKHPGKEDCHVIDLVSSLKVGIVTTPTLFGLDADELVSGKDTQEMKSLKERKEKERLREEQASIVPTQSPSQQAPLPGNITFTDYDDVNDLIEDTSGERHIRAISRYAWVQVDQDRYMLSSSSGEFLTLKRAESHSVTKNAPHNQKTARKPEQGTPSEIIEYVVIYNLKLPNATTGKSPYMRPRQIAAATSFERGVRAADRFAKEKFPLPVIVANAPWRDSPATPGQIQYLNRFRDEDDKLQEDTITKGKAGDLITKMVHGARGRFDKLAVAKRKATEVTKRGDQFKERQKRAQIKVGPLRSSTFS